LYGNKIDLSIFRAMLNWRVNPKISVWAIARILDASIVESRYASQIPYLPEFTFEYSLQASLGYGYRVVLQGVSAGDRYASAFQGSQTVTVLKPYFIQNLEISKLINNRFEIFVILNNILDETYEIWQGYESPGFTGYGGIKLFW
jgi:outer membrane cobalamin receptor